MRPRRRYRLVAALLVVVAAGCASDEPAGRPVTDAAIAPTSAGSGPGGQAPAPSREPLRYSEPVAEPKDARGVEACELITDEQVAQLGLIPESAEQRDQGPGIQTCVWSSAIYPTSPVSIQKSTEGVVPVLDGMHLIENPLLPDEDRVVAGHPAVRSELADTGFCTITAAVSDYQGIGVKNDQPKSDPCPASMRIAEFVLSNLPPLIEE